MTTGSIFLVVLSAVSGAAFVLAGLLMERFSEKDWHKNLYDFRRCKSINIWGERLVIIGIGIEMVVGIVSAIDAWQSKPENQNINNVEAHIFLFGKFDFSPQERAIMNGSGVLRINTLPAWLSAGRMNEKEAAPILDNGKPALFALSSDNVDIDNNGNVNLDMKWAMLDVKADNAFKAAVVNEVNWLKLECPFISPRSELLGGAIWLKVDPMPAREFEIPAQKLSDLSEIRVFVLENGKFSATPPK